MCYVVSNKQYLAIVMNLFCFWTSTVVYVLLQSMTILQIIHMFKILNPLSIYLYLEEEDAM